MGRIGRVAVVFALVGMVAVVGGFGPEARPARAASADATSNRVSGVILQTYQHQDLSAVDFSRIAADGANEVNIAVWWEVPSSSANEIVPTTGVTIPDAALEQAIQAAEAAGLQVTLTPDFGVGSKFTWRGYYNPSDPQAFFASYTQMVDHYAAIAQQYHMPMFWVGSEMDETEQYSTLWRQLIASVRKIYTGEVVYEVNWDQLFNVTFWDALDAISISAYFPLSNDADPSLAQLEAGWHSYTSPDNTFSGDWYAQITTLAERWDKPILFGEAGYMASTYAAELPSETDYYSYDPGLQERCYEALLFTFHHEKWWDGVLWWSWNDNPYRTPEGEPAEAYINAKWVAYNYPPPPPAPTSAGGSTESASGASAASATPQSTSGPAGAPRTSGGEAAVSASATPAPVPLSKTGTPIGQHAPPPSALSPLTLGASPGPGAPLRPSRAGIEAGAAAALVAAGAATLAAARRRGRPAWRSRARSPAW